MTKRAVCRARPRECGVPWTGTALVLRHPTAEVQVPQHCSRPRKSSGGQYPECVVHQDVRADTGMQEKSALTGRESPCSAEEVWNNLKCCGPTVYDDKLLKIAEHQDRVVASPTPRVESRLLISLMRRPSRVGGSFCNDGNLSAPLLVSN